MPRCLPLYLLCLSVCMSVRLGLSLSLFLSVSLSVCLSFCLYFSISLSLYLYLSLFSLSLFLSLSLSLFTLSLSLSLSLSLYQFICLSKHTLSFFLYPILLSLILPPHHLLSSNCFNGTRVITIVSSIYFFQTTKHSSVLCTRYKKITYRLFGANILHLIFTHFKLMIYIQSYTIFYE